MHVHERPPKLDCIIFDGSKLVPSSKFKIFILEVDIKLEKSKICLHEDNRKCICTCMW